MGGEGPLDEAVLQGVEGDDGQAAVVGKDRKRRLDRGGGLVEFAVHGDAQRLEGARGGVARGAAAAADGAFDDVGEARGRDDGLAGLLAHNRAGDAHRVGLFAVLAEQPRQRGGVVAERGDQLRGGAAARGVHAHVQRAVGPEGEAALRLVELEGRDAQVEQHAVDAVEPVRARHAAQIGELRVHRLEAVAERREPLAAARDRGGVAVQPQQPSVGRARAKHLLRVAAPAERPVDIAPPGARVERLERFMEQDGNVHGGQLTTNS